MTQEELATIVGKSRSAIANSMRLLGLGEKVKVYLVSGELSSGHARALIAIEENELQQKAAEEVIKNGLNVRDTEKLVKKYLSKKVKVKQNKDNAEIVNIEEKLQNIFGTKVKLLTNNKKGKIMIEYYSNDELERILELISDFGKK